MATIEPLTEVALGEVHLGNAVALSAEAHWNQISADWAMMIGQGMAIGLAKPDGQLVATALVLPYGDRFGWISMVLVTQTWRQQGLASRLLRRSIDRLEERRLVPVLDATPAGENVYRPLGFKPHFRFQRWQGELPPAARPAPQPAGDEVSRPFAPEDMAAVEAYDAEVFDGPRPLILRGIAGRGGGLARIALNGRGFLLSRDGRMARQIGPIDAENADTALAMLERALDVAHGPLFIDVPDHQTAVTSYLQSRGFAVQRPFLRMLKGEGGGFGDPDRMFALAGPELG